MKSSVSRFRLFIAVTVFSFILCALIMACLNAAFDPLHILRASYQNDYYDSESRFGMPGLILHNATPHAVVGSSIVQDFDQRHYVAKADQAISRYFHAGGTAYEQRRLIETLLKAENPPETIIWGVAPTSFFAPSLDSIRWDQFPEHLYQPDPSVLEYLVSFQTFYRLIRQIPPRLKQDSRTEYERYTSDDKASPRGQEQIYKSYCGGKMEERVQRLGKYNYELMGDQIKTNMLAIINDHPDTEFVLFLPPYSIVQFVEFDKGGVLDEVLNFRTLLADLTKDLPNVTLYDFQDDISLITNMDYYYDGVHYTADVTRIMTDDMIAGRNKVRNGNIETGNTTLRAAVEKHKTAIWNNVARYCDEAGEPVH